MSSAICFNLDRCKILSFGNGLNDDPISDWEENIEGKGENGYQHFLLFPSMF